MDESPTREPPMQINGEPKAAEPRPNLGGFSFSTPNFGAQPKESTSSPFNFGVTNSSSNAFGSGFNKPEENKPFGGGNAFGRGFLIGSHNDWE